MTNINQAIDGVETLRYLEILYPDPPENAQIVISWLTPQGNWRSEWFRTGAMDDIAARMADRAQRQNLYMNIGLRNQKSRSSVHRRGDSQDVCAIPGLWADLDHNKGVHAEKHLPSPEELIAFIATLPFECSLVINSGGGLHPYLLFREVWLLDTPEEHARAALLMRKFIRYIQERAREHGWGFDSVSDLARVLRPAGTFNHKFQTPRAVTIVHEDGIRYNPSDLEVAPWLPELEDFYVPAPSTHHNGTGHLASLPLIEQNCAWLGHCWIDAATLPEPEWYALLGILGRCEDGEALAQAWSQPYPRYKQHETRKKLAHALQAAGPATCSRIRYDLGGEPYCRECPSWGQRKMPTVKSPIVLGMPRRPPGSDPLASAKNGHGAQATHGTQPQARGPETVHDGDTTAPREKQGRGPSQATVLVGLARQAGAELFHTPESEPYATIPVGNHRETWHCRARSFKLWLARLYYAQREASPNAEALQAALNTLQGEGLFNGPQTSVHTRLAEHEGAIYLDLGDDTWTSVCITPAGWELVQTLPVKFRRMPGMLALPKPVRGGTLAALRPLINVGSDSSSESNWRLIVHWLLAALRPRGPYPILIVHGGHGSAKSTLVRILRGLVDPHMIALRRPPKDERDIAIAATNSWVFALDNLSRMPEWLSDALCCLATGTGFATRALKTDSDEAQFAATRPIVVNGIEEIATRDDFLSRALIVHLPSLAGKAIPERELWRRVEDARPQILGACCDIITRALQVLPTVTLQALPRMADFTEWSAACADACGWTATDFLTAYQEVREASYALTLEASLIWPPLHDLLTKHQQWQGNATELLAALCTRVEGPVQKQKEWPRRADVLSNTLRRLQPTLREVNIDVVFDRDETPQRNRRITLTNTGGGQ